MLFATLTIAATLANALQSQPSFDCGRASTPVERAICADPELARLDRRMAVAYSSARLALPPPARRVLADDQRWFLYVRDEYYEGRANYDWAAILTDRLVDRASFLESIDPVSRDGLIGQWGNTAIGIEVTPQKDGRVHISVGGADPLTARWTCGIEVDAVMRGRTAYAIDPESPSWGMQLTRDGATLRVTETGPDGQQHTSDYCGFGGYVAGDYLPTRSEDSQTGDDAES
jgi:uncharacterized protein YecT (DUF1311 family)